MKKILILCFAFSFTCTLFAQARVKFLGNDDDAFRFSPPKAVKIECEDGYVPYGNSCIIDCDSNLYPFLKKPDETKGAVEKCPGIPPRWRYTLCYKDKGYEGNKNGDCAPIDCKDYTIKESDKEESKGTYIGPCLSAGVNYYKLKECKPGYEPNINRTKCVVKDCPVDKYPYPSEDDAKGCEKRRECQTINDKGVLKTYYGCISCKKDYEPDGAYCNLKTGKDDEPCSITFDAPPSGNISSPLAGEKEECEISLYYEPSGDIATIQAVDGTYCLKCKPGFCADKKTGYCKPEDDGDEEDNDECKVGYIYYADDTCSDGLIKEKEAIGVILSTAPKEKWVVGLEEKALKWLQEAICDGHTCAPNIKNLIDFPVNECPVNDNNGKINTDIIIKFGQEKNLHHPAAEYCVNYKAGGKSWYLPALGQVHRLRDTYGPREKLDLIGKGLSLYNLDYWSSTEMSPYVVDGVEDSSVAQAWKLNMLNKNFCFSQPKSASSLTRCMFNYTSAKLADGGNSMSSTACLGSKWPNCGTSKDKSATVSEQADVDCMWCKIEGIPAIIGVSHGFSGTSSDTNGCDVSSLTENGQTLNHINARVGYYFWWPQLGETEADKNFSTRYHTGWAKCNPDNADFANCIQKGLDECSKDLDKYYPIDQTVMPTEPDGSNTGGSAYLEHYSISKNVTLY